MDLLEGGKGTKPWRLLKPGGSDVFPLTTIMARRLRCWAGLGNSGEVRSSRVGGTDSFCSGDLQPGEEVLLL